MVAVTSIHAGLLALVFLALSVRVIGTRRTERIGLGDGGSRVLLRRMRAHANFAEYVPLGILLIGLAELQAAPAWLLHVLGAALLAGRIAHAVGVSREPEGFGRVPGMILTLTVLGLAALLCLSLALLDWPAGG